MTLIGLVIGNLFAFQEVVERKKKMEIRWHEIRQVDDLYQLLIEGSVTPQDIYHIVKNTISYDHILITSYDMESDDFNALTEEFDKYGVEYEILEEGIEVRKGWLNCVFEYSDFGESQDSYKLMQPNSKELSSDFDISVDYRDIPDLKIRCKSKSYLESILNNVKLQVANKE